MQLSKPKMNLFDTKILKNLINLPNFEHFQNIIL